MVAILKTNGAVQSYKFLTQFSSFTNFCEKVFVPRTRAGHDHQCELIKHDPDLSKTYDVNRKSVLCNSRYFHVVDSLLADAMHDLLEGVLQYECKEMLSVFVYQINYFTLQTVNPYKNFL